MGKVFDSRSGAAREPAEALTAYRGRNPLVLAILRGPVSKQYPTTQS